MSGKKLNITINGESRDIVVNERIDFPMSYILSSINDFKYLNKPFEDMQVSARFTDIDICIERNRHFIFGEIKKEGKCNTTGQTILLEQLQKLNQDFKPEFTSKIVGLIIWVEEEDGLWKKPIRYKIYKSNGKIIDVKENVEEKLYTFLVDWWQFVNKE